MDLKKAIKSVNILNIDWDESTASKDTFLSNEDNDSSSFIVSDADEEILILIEFVDCVDLHNIIFTALPLEDNNDTSVPKEIHLYKATNVCVNFDDMSSLSADKVIEGKAKKLSKGQKVSLRKKLAFRQIKYLIIYVKANQNDSEKTHLHKIEINGTCNAKLNENKQQIIKTFDESKYIQRIDELFEKQQSNKMSDEDFYDLVCSKYPNEDIANFLNDYHKFIKNMDSKRSNMVCSKKDCAFLKRQNRYKRNGNGNKQSMIRQKLQQIHILCHQYDEEQKMKNDKNYKRQMIKEKSAECEDMDEKEPQSNKFVTDIEASSASLMNGKYLKYLEGFKFYYHSFYKDKVGVALGAEFNHETMSNYRHSDEVKHRMFKYWYVLPKYANLKDEIIDGGHLTLDQFKMEISKAEQNVCTAEAKQLVASDSFEERYNVKNGSAITVQQMLCVMLYTNYDKLQNKLSKTFRKTSDAETFEQLKQRHTSFVHLSRCITEAVKCFGDTGKLDVNLYHGMNALTIFEDFTALFCGPTSTTTSLSVAFKFATNKGTVITIQGIRNHFSSNRFDCELWSDYPLERERLFIGMNFRMHIVNVHDLRNDIEYEEWIDVIRTLSHLFIVGTHLSSPISQLIEEKVHLLLNSVTNNTVTCIPEYIVDTFNNIRMNTKYVRIDVNLLSKDIYWKHKDSAFVLHGGKTFENVYFDKNGNIKWMFINSLFPNLTMVHIVNMIPDEENVNLTSFSNSILLTDDVLNDILEYLSFSNMNEIDIFSPQDNLYSLKQQATKFSAKYEENGYHLDIRKSGVNDRTLNECVVFQVKRGKV